MSPPASSRWCPTPQQLMILEEMYRSGIRTPNASQIQRITSHLSFYGKIEGKNVFYWFQNHKARDRQKLRRKLSKQLQQQQQQQQLYHPRYHPQLVQHNEVQNHNFLHYFDSPASPVFRPSFLPQGRVDDSPRQVINYTWKSVDIPHQGAVEIDNSMTRMYGSDWMMMMVEVGPAASSPFCRRPPLKTLELFPLTASNLKEECEASKHHSSN